MIQPPPSEAPNRNGAPRRSGIRAWIPEYDKLGYSHDQASEVARIAERLWVGYTAAGSTIDSLHATPTALDPVEVLVQAMFHFGLNPLLSARSALAPVGQEERPRQHDASVSRDDSFLSTTKL